MSGLNQTPYTKQLDEPCPDCGRKPISGQFVVMGRFVDPEIMREVILGTGVMDVRVDGSELHSLIDWTCSDPVCAKKKTYTEAPAVRLARRAQR